MRVVVGPRRLLRLCGTGPSIARALLLWAFLIPAAPADDAAGTTPSSAAATAIAPAVITGVYDSNGKTAPVGLNDDLLIAVGGSGSPPAAIEHLDGSRYALFLNGREVKGIPYGVFDPDRHALVFTLKRSDANRDLWTSLLGSPMEFERLVKVSLAERPGDGTSGLVPTIRAQSTNPNADTLRLEEIPPIRLGIGMILIGGFIWLLWIRARRDATMRDSFLPQIEPAAQTYSLGRWQMAFWFTLVFGSFAFLFLLTWDFNTISDQALALMGISGGTALAAMVVDAAKDSPADAVSRGLQALGLNNYADVLRIRGEIDALAAHLSGVQAALGLLPNDASLSIAQLQQQAQLQQNLLKLNTDIVGRQGILRTYDDKTRPFRTRGWFRDLTTDNNGIAIHRLQVFAWTWVLGIVYVIGVYRDLAMPEFSPQLLALMGISAAGYVGFKYPEANS